MATKLAQLTETWNKYELGKNHHNETNMYESTAKAWRFYEGDQWYGIDAGGSFSELPSMNFLKSMVDYKFITVASQNIKLIYNPFDFAEPDAEIISKALNKYAEQKWESQKMDSKMWKSVLRAAVAGDDYAFFYGKNLDCQLIDNTAVYFADEQQEDVQKQEYIIITERRPVATIRREAEKNGIKKADIQLIVADKDDETVVGDNHEVDETAETGKCLSLLYLTRDDNDNVTFSRSTKYVEYEPKKTIKGMTLYPIARLVWDAKKNSVRGNGEVKPQISNQIEINRLLVRRMISAKMNAFAKPVYVENLIDNPADVDKIGKAIKLKTGNVSDIKNAFTYMAPAPMSPEAGTLQQYFLDSVRNLSSSGDAATGNVNPERAAASAIIAIRDQAALPMNKHLSSYKQYIEDIGLIWLDMWRAYGEKLETTSLINIVTPAARIPATVLETATIEKGDLEKIKLDVKIDTTPTTPYSVWAAEQALQVYEQQGKITFAEMIKALPNNSITPKNTLQRILDERERNPAPDMQQLGMQPTGKAGTNTPMSEGMAQPTTVMSRPTMG